MTNYSQTLDEIFNILTLHLPVDRLQRTSFIGHFTLRSEPFDLLMATGQRICSIDVFEFESPIIKPNPEFVFNFDQLFVQFKKYFSAQEKARHTYSLHQSELNKTLEQAEHAKLSTNLYGGMNQVKPFREIKLQDTIFAPPELTINYDEIRQSSNIPNRGKASR